MRTMRKSEGKIFYKFKSLDNFEFLLDLIVRDRLYAAKLCELNDPMEGIIKADPKVPRDLHSQWEAQLEEVRIASFTAEKDSDLMWAHYADGGRGCKIGFELHPSVRAEPVMYKSAPKWDGTPVDRDKLCMLLRYKLNPWRYEREYRVVVTGNRFVPVKVRSIEFGPQIESDRKSLLEHTLFQLRPDIKITTKTISGKVNPIRAIAGATQFFRIRPQSFDGCHDCADRADRISYMSFFRQVDCAQRHFDQLDEDQQRIFLEQPPMDK